MKTSNQKPVEPREPRKNHAIKATRSEWADFLLVGLPRIRAYVKRTAAKIRSGEA